MMRSPSVVARDASVPFPEGRVPRRDASVPFRVTDRVRVLPHSDRDVVLGTAEGSIRVVMKNRWGSVSVLLAHARLTVNFDVKEDEIQFIQTMAPAAMLCASFREVDVEHMPDEPHGASCASGSVYVAVGRKYILNKTLYGGKFSYCHGGHSESTLRHSFESRLTTFGVPFPLLFTGVCVLFIVPGGVLILIIY